jgi:hypothetical protein
MLARLTTRKNPTATSIAAGPELLAVGLANMSYNKLDAGRKRLANKRPSQTFECDCLSYAGTVSHLADGRLAENFPSNHNNSGADVGGGEAAIENFQGRVSAPFVRPPRNHRQERAMKTWRPRRYPVSVPSRALLAPSPRCHRSECLGAGLAKAARCPYAGATYPMCRRHSWLSRPDAIRLLGINPALPTVPTPSSSLAWPVNPSSFPW